MIIKFSDHEDISVYRPEEVAQMLVDCCDLELDDDERITNVSLEFGCDLEIEINGERTETYTIRDLTIAFDVADFIAWAKDENDNDILVCA